MRQDSLSDLISGLEQGTNLHISVSFFGDYGNQMTRCAKSQCIHSSPVCAEAKKTPEDFAQCFRCRNIVRKLAQRRRRSFGGLCVNGVYEYCRPIVYRNAVVGLISIGNILTEDPEQRVMLQNHFDDPLLQTMEHNFTLDMCQRTADLLERYTLSLLEAYGLRQQKHNFNPLIDNICSYIEENLLYDLSLKDLAAAFNYDDKYLGRMFKSKTGCSVREFCNKLKIERAKNLLRNSKLTVCDIAFQCGYNNAAYFNRVFKAQVGTAPLKYRRTHTLP